MIALFQAADAGADVDDDARALVPENRRKQPFRVGARTGELVGVAHAGRLDFDQHLARLGAVQLHGVDHQRGAGLVRYRCADIHRSLLDWPGRSIVMKEGTGEIVRPPMPYG